MVQMKEEKGGRYGGLNERGRRREMWWFKRNDPHCLGLLNTWHCLGRLRRCDLAGELTCLCRWAFRVQKPCHSQLSVSVSLSPSLHPFFPFLLPFLPTSSHRLFPLPLLRERLSFLLSSWKDTDLIMKTLPSRPHPYYITSHFSSHKPNMCPKHYQNIGPLCLCMTLKLNHRCM